VTLMLELTFLPSSRLTIAIMVCPVRSLMDCVVVTLNRSMVEEASEAVHLPASEGHAIQVVPPVPCQYQAVCSAYRWLCLMK